ncbi:hypothetical protein ACNQGP_00640 [Flavobacterium sp. GT2N3]|uniref:hypothetical protein n=1 Tax=unclassified Flavobacterium TaxID=196869 RepID=UPI003AADAD4C
MSYVKYSDILDATNGGLEIIISYYQNAQKVTTKTTKQFKIRESENTASAALKEGKNGVWRVTDYGGDSIGRNGIEVCMLEEDKSFEEACAILGSRYNIKGAEKQVYKPIIKQRSLSAEEIPDTKHIVYKEFTATELALIGPRVNKQHCADFKLRSCESITYLKTNQATIVTATDEYPISVFDFGTWQKIYQPNAEDKGFRFSYAGAKPARHVFGLDLIEKEFKANKKAQEDAEGDYSVTDESDNGDDERKVTKKNDPRLDAVFIVSGGSDGINLRSFGKFPIWFNSETDHLEWDEFKQLKVWAKEIYYVADLDNTGIKQAIGMGLKFLDIKLLWLPQTLKQYKDKRGNPCKDVKDYVEKMYRKDNANAFTTGLDKLVHNALPMQFWTEYFHNKKTNYNLSNTRLYHFLSLMGFGRYENKNVKDGYIYIKKEGSIVKILRPDQIQNYVHGFLQERQMHPDLRDYVYNSPKVGANSMSNLPTIKIDFTDADRHTQYLFFTKKVWKVTATEILEYKQGEVDKFVWEEKIIDFNIKKEEPHFNISTDADGNLDIDVIKKDNPFFNYLINTSRVHWRKDLEESFEGKKPSLEEEYFKANQFNIAGPNLSEDEVYEQKLHLINKMYSIGYILHKYKDESRAWCVFAMDNKISDNGESHGGSGKSLGYSYLDNFLRRFYIEGRNQKNVESEFVYHGVDEDTDFILIDDASQYLKFENYFSAITGSLKVNPKNGTPFEIAFSKAPKFVISSNFTVRDPDPSTVRRLLFTVFSDYYHYNKDGEYKQVRQVSDDFAGRNLFKDFTEAEWNAYYNFCIQCIQFYLGHPTKVDPPMDNVTKRSLQAEMGDAFMGWAEAFFETMSPNETTFSEEPKYLDNYFSKQAAFENYQIANKGSKWLVTKFKKAMIAYSKLNGYIFNPKELQNDKGRIIQKIDGKSQEAFFIRTIETPDAFKQAENVTEYQTEEEIFN